MIEVRVLGPLRVVRDGRPVTLRAAMLRHLLAVLSCRPGETVSVSTLIEALWGENPPRSAHKTLQVYVHRLRQALGGKERIAHDSWGYALVAGSAELDALRFEKLVGQGRAAQRAGDLESAGALLQEALRLWQGAAFADMREIPIIADEALRLEEQRLVTCEDLMAADLDLGRPGEPVAELTGVRDLLPYRERLCVLAMLSLYRAGRQVEALSVFRRARDTLVQDLGVEPGALLRHVHEAILRDDAGLFDPVDAVLARASGVAWERSTPRRAEPAAPDLLPPDISDFTGRGPQVAVLVEVLSGSGPATAVPIAAVTGRTGVGKSTLAVHVAHRLRDAFPDGRLYVDLHGADAPADPHEVLGRFLAVLGMDASSVPEGLEERAESFRALVADRRVLVVLDNAGCEHQVRPLLPGGPGCAVLVTGRRRFAGLSAHTLRLDDLDTAAGRDLLGRIVGCDRVSAEPAAAAEIAELCGGLPLALRVAGARLAAREHWTLARMAGRLRSARRRLDELDAGNLSVRARLAPAYGALGDGTRRAFRLLGLLETPAFTVRMAAALLDTGLEEAEFHIDALVDGGLLASAGTDPHGALRYRFPDLERLYAMERGEAEESPCARRAALSRALGAWLPWPKRQLAESPNA